MVLEITKDKELKGAKGRTLEWVQVWPGIDGEYLSFTWGFHLPFLKMTEPGRISGANCRVNNLCVKHSKHLESL